MEASTSDIPRTDIDAAPTTPNSTSSGKQEPKKMAFSSGLLMAHVCLPSCRPSLEPSRQERA